METGTTARDEGAVLEEMAGTCLLMRTRILSRVVSAIYDEKLRSFGINSSQCSLLMVVWTLGPARRADIGRFYHQDRSTLTRNLQIMLGNGWIEETEADADGRGKPVAISAAGTKLLRDLSPAWRQAQNETAKLLGDHGAAVVSGVANGIMSGPAEA